MRKIEDEGQYQNSLRWLTEKAKLLEHPLLDDEAKEKLMKQYDFVSQAVREYNLNRPEMIVLYRKLGLLEEEQEQQMESIDEPKQEEKTSVNLADWLDE